MEGNWYDGAVGSAVALLTGWLLKSFFSASRREVEEIRRELRSFVTTQDLDRELSSISTRLDRLDTKLDKLLDHR